MGTPTLNELVTKVHDHGAELRVVEGHLRFSDPHLPEEIKIELRERNDELIKELTWDQKRAYVMLQEALVYINEVRVKTGSLFWEKAECDEDPVLQHAINEAFADEDMWLFRIARRAWVMAWVRAIAEVKEDAVA